MSNNKNFPESKNLIIAIDGPAASGKSTVALMLSKKLGLKYIDSGSMYRTVTLVSLEENVKANDESSLVEIAKEVRRNFKIVLDSSGVKVFLGKRDVTSDIRSKEVGENVSPVSAFEGVREEMVALQREMAKGGAVVEGRDIGSKVFPDASLKVYLDAKVEERIKRRYLEYKSKGKELKYEEVKREILLRDSIDSSRKASPLSIPQGAFVIDTTEITPGEVTDVIIKKCKTLAII